MKLCDHIWNMIGYNSVKVPECSLCSVRRSALRPPVEAWNGRRSHVQYCTVLYCTVLYCIVLCNMRADRQINNDYSRGNSTVSLFLFLFLKNLFQKCNTVPFFPALRMHNARGRAARRKQIQISLVLFFSFFFNRKMIYSTISNLYASLFYFIFWIFFCFAFFETHELNYYIVLLHCSMTEGVRPKTWSISRYLHMWNQVFGCTQWVHSEPRYCTKNKIQCTVYERVEKHSVRLVLTQTRNPT